MPKTLTKSRLRTKKQKLKKKQELYNTNRNLPSHLQTFKENLLSGNGFVECR